MIIQNNTLGHPGGNANKLPSRSAPGPFNQLGLGPGKNHRTRFFSERVDAIFSDILDPDTLDVFLLVMPTAAADCLLHKYHPTRTERQKLLELLASGNDSDFGHNRAKLVILGLSPLSLSGG